MDGAGEHALTSCGWHPSDMAWRTYCQCGWQSKPRDYNEEALADFRRHRLDGLGWRLIRGEGRRDW
jgi:hypothetical protein